MNNEIMAFWARIYPLSDLPRTQQGEVGSHVSQKHVSSGEVLPLDQEVLYIIRHGAMQVLDRDVVIDSLIPGDYFGYEVFFFSRLAGQSAMAVQDATLLTLPGSVFRKLLQHDSADRFFRGKADILRNRARDIHHWRTVSRIDPYLRLTLRDVDMKSPVFVPVEATVVQAAKSMLHMNATTCLVVNDQDILGIATERDILKKVVARDVDPNMVNVRAIMCSPLITVKHDDLLFEAFSKMVRSGIRRLVVMNDKAEVKGIIEERDLLSVKGENPVYLAGEIARAETFSTLGSVFRRLQGMAMRSVGEGIGIFQVGRLISDMNDQILTRVRDLVLAEMGQGAPVPFCLLALGSEGRREQYLATDQDNALIFSWDGQDKTLIFFERFARKFIQALLDLGIPPCAHEVMITNPRWRMSLDQWMDVVDKMIRENDLDSILMTSLLVDMRCVAGDAGLAGKLKSYLFKRVGGSSFILKYMAHAALRFTPPVGFFSAFVVEKSGEHKGEMNIKKGGVFPVTQGVRTLAVEYNILETATEERIKLLRDAGVFSAGLAAGIREAYEFFQTLRVRTQVERVRDGEKPNNFIAPDRLSIIERDRLKDCFKVVNEFQALLQNKYGLHLLT
ncbi:MAG TPA: CBS domain-containing protein [Desulfonatronum sp.]|nr:CBS domain-containing protein [Desulfonatronum sp.]